jgi:hypothetical protein
MEFKKQTGWVLGAALLGACAVNSPTSQQSQNVKEADDSIIITLNQQTIAAIGTAPAPFAATRFMAIVQVAVYEAVNACTGRYTPYFGVTAAAGADPSAAAIVAAHDTLVWLFPAKAATLDAQQAASLAGIDDGQAKTDGIAAGHAAAQAMIAQRTGDGSAPPQFFAPPNTNPGMWQKTPSCPPAGGVFKQWPNVKPFGIASSSQFRVDPPPDMTSDAYAQAYNETQAVGEKNSTLRPQDRADVARYYAAVPAHAAWNSLAQQLFAERKSHNSISDSSRVLALLNMAQADGMFAIFDSKYFYNLWRPETAIPRGAEDGNPLTVPGPFVPYVVTPCFPSYPSAHGIGAGTAATVLTTFFGNGGHDLTQSTPSVPGVTLHYTQLDDVVKDISDARVFGGIHFRFDQDVAEAQGAEVASWDLANYMQDAP